MKLLPFVLGVAVLVAPLAGEAQQTARLVKIGVLCAGFCPFGGGSGSIQPFIDALERVGLVQGRTLVLDSGSVVNSEDQLAVAARKLVARRPDLILVWPGNVAAARAAKEATQTIPIVLMAIPDAVEHGLVPSLGHPGGNISGISVPTYDLTIKQLQVLKEINPQLKGVVVVHGHLDSGERKTVERLRGAAASLHLSSGITVIDVSNVEQALTATPTGTRCVLTTGNLPTVVHRRVRLLALERKLPLVLSWRASWHGDSSGTLISYGPRFSAVADRTAAVIDRIVKGARPRDLPVEEPTSYELVIDLVMAKALGLTIPPGVRARADEVLD